MPRTQGILGRPQKVAVELESNSSEEITESSSEEIREDQPSGQQKKSQLKISQKQPSTMKEVAVAPHSTTHTDPQVRPSEKRAKFQAKLKREEAEGKPAKHRIEDADLAKQYPQLKSLKLSQLEKDFKKANPTLDMQKLTAQFNSTSRRLDVEVNSKASAWMVSEFLRKNSPVKAIKLSGVFNDGEALAAKSSTDDLSDAERVRLRNRPDPKSFDDVLFTARDVEELDLSDCRFDDKGAASLTRRLAWSPYRTIRRLCLGSVVERSLSKDVNEKLIDTIVMVSNVDELEFRNVLFEGKEPFNFVEKSSAYSEFRKSNIRSLKFSEIYTYDGFPFETLFLYSTGPHSGVSTVSVTKSEIKLPEDESEEYFNTCCQCAASANFLRVLDLTDCGLSEHQMKMVAAIVKHCPVLEEIRIDGNEVSKATQTAMIDLTDKNKQVQAEKRNSLKIPAAATYDLLVKNSRRQPTEWGKELSEVLAENSPPEVLEALAKMIGEGADSHASSGKEVHPDPKSDHPDS
jgi:hypothetical protein